VKANVSTTDANKTVSIFILLQLGNSKNKLITNVLVPLIHSKFAVWAWRTMLSGQQHTQHEGPKFAKKQYTKV
jgi:hypothetical protein